jgi:hypothetical protein
MDFIVAVFRPDVVFERFHARFGRDQIDMIKPFFEHPVVG